MDLMINKFSLKFHMYFAYLDTSTTPKVINVAKKLLYVLDCPLRLRARFWDIL